MTSYSIFLDLLSFTDNPLLIQLFQNLALGISNYPGLSFDYEHKCLFYNKIKIPFYNISPHLLFNSLNKHIFKKKIIKDSIIESFIIEQSILYDLSTPFTKKLISYVFLALLFKNLTYKNFHFNNGHLHKIDGISFFSKKIIIHKNILNIISSPKLDDVFSFKTNKTLAPYWSLYIQEL